MPHTRPHGPGAGRRPHVGRWALVALAGLAIGLLATVAAGAQEPERPTVTATAVSGAITPVVATHLADVVAEANEAGHEAVLVTLDTPGGGLDATREIVQTFLDARVPVVVHVAPGGADAGSAGTFITYAAHVAAMAPATTIGAATPVDMEGQEVGDKVVENTAAFARALAEERGRDPDFAVDAVRDGRSVTADTALEEGVVDVVVASRQRLLEQLDGREVELADGTRTLDTAEARTVEAPLSGTRSILQLLANPNLAFVFLTLGTLGILYEIASPGMGLGGAVGGISLVLAMFSLSVLPISWAGIALVLLAAGLFVAELFMPGVGVGAGGGTIALLFGGLFLFEEPTGIALDGWVLGPVVAVAFVLCLLAGRLVARAHRGRSRVASDYLLGRPVVVEHAAEGTPRGRLDGTWWRLRPRDDTAPLRDGERYEVVDRDNLDLIVEPPGATSPTHEEEER